MNQNTMGSPGQNQCTCSAPLEHHAATNWLVSDLRRCVCLGIRIVNSGFANRTGKVVEPCGHAIILGGQNDVARFDLNESAQVIEVPGMPARCEYNAASQSLFTRGCFELQDSLRKLRFGKVLPELRQNVRSDFHHTPNDGGNGAAAK